MSDIFRLRDYTYFLFSLFSKLTNNSKIPKFRIYARAAFKTDGIQIVPKSSAILDGIESQEVPIDAKYRDVSKFGGLEDPNLVRIQDCLRKIIAEAESRTVDDEVRIEPEANSERSQGTKFDSKIGSAAGANEDAIKTNHEILINENAEDQVQALLADGQQFGMNSSFNIMPPVYTSETPAQAVSHSIKTPGTISDKVQARTKHTLFNNLSTRSEPPELSDNAMSEKLSKSNFQKTASGIITTTNKGIQYAPASLLTEKLSTTAPAAAVSDWVKVTAVGTVGGALGIGAVNAGAAWKSANAAARSADAGEQSAIAAVLNAQTAAAKLRFDIAESAKPKDKPDESGSGTTFVAGPSKTVKQPLEAKETVPDEGTHALLDQLPSTQEIIMNTNQASQSIGNFLDRVSRRQEEWTPKKQKELDNVTKLQKQRKLEKQETAVKKKINIVSFRKPKNSFEGISSTAEKSLPRKLKAMRHSLEKSGSGGAPMKHDPKGKGKAEDVEDAISESSSDAAPNGNSSDQAEECHSAGRRVNPDDGIAGRKLKDITDAHKVPGPSRYVHNS